MRPYGEGLKVYLYREPVDMRMWRNGLAAVAQQVMKVDPGLDPPMLICAQPGLFRLRDYAQLSS